jgi:hypothetical protein
MAINVELENLYFADKKEREELNDSDEDAVRMLEENDKKRLIRVQEILSEIDTSEIWNCHYLALLFQHGETIEDYKIAYEYAKKAVDMGSNVTKWLYAATLDRWLVAQGEPQKFGTQFRQIDGKWELLPVDNRITDEERIKYGVSPLSQALESFNKKYHK